MFITTLQELMSKNNLNNSTLSKESGIAYTTIDGFFKKGTDNIKLSTLIKLSDYFNVSLDYLIYGEKEEPVVQNFRVTEPISPTFVSVTSEDEQELIQNYNNLNDEGKERLLENSREYTELSKYKKDNQSEMGKKQA